MKVVFQDSFEKDLSKIKDQIAHRQIKKAILKAENAELFQKITNIKSITGHKNAYRLRAGDYRIGVIMKEDVLHLVRVAHRKEIYRLFP